MHGITRLENDEINFEIDIDFGGQKATVHNRQDRKRKRSLEDPNKLQACIFKIDNNIDSNIEMNWFIHRRAHGSYIHCKHAYLFSILRIQSEYGAIASVGQRHEFHMRLNTKGMNAFSWSVVGVKGYNRHGESYLMTHDLTGLRSKNSPACRF
eukprot:scaffold233580_cov19-Prasinocladus_malaysianus.AAC.2